MCPPGMWASPSPVSIHANPLASWEGLWGHSVSPVGTYERHETRRAPSSGGRLQLPFGGWCGRTSLFPSRSVVAAAKGPRMGGPARKPRSAPILAPAGPRQPPSGWFRGPCVSQVSRKTRLQSGPAPAASSTQCVAHQAGRLSPSCFLTFSYRAVIFGNTLPAK